MNGCGRAFVAVLRRDLVIGFRHRSELGNPVVFNIIVALLFIFALGNDPVILGRLAAAIIWVCAVLASTLSLERLFTPDYEDGTLEQLLLSAQPLPLLVAAKILAHWLLCGLPLVVAALLLGVLLYLPQPGYPPLLLTLLLGTPVFSLLGALLAALTVGLRGSGVLLALLILPLYIPVLIFAVAAVSDAVHGLSIAGQIYFLASLFVLALTLLPFATAATLRLRLG